MSFLGAVSMLLCYMGVEKDCDSSSTVISVSKMFVVCGIDRGRFWMIHMLYILHNYLVWNMSLWLLVIYFLHQYFNCTYCEYSNHLNLCSNTYLWLHVSACTVYQVVLRRKSRWSCLISNIILCWKFRNDYV